MSFEKALSAIDAAHSEDPTLITPSSSSSSTPIPYELHYANKMTHYLDLHTPSASQTLRLAVRAQHLRRWEVPRNTYPLNRAGYLSWRTYLKKRQAEIVERICVEEGGYSPEEAGRVGKLVRKEGLLGSKGGEEGEGEREVQILEDVACLVFLDDQFEKFEKEQNDEEKILGILRKTWGKMSERGKELALKIEMSDRARGLIEKAVTS